MGVDPALVFEGNWGGGGKTGGRSHLLRRLHRLSMEKSRGGKKLYKGPVKVWQLTTSCFAALRKD